MKRERERMYCKRVKCLKESIHPICFEWNAESVFFFIFIFRLYDSANSLIFFLNYFFFSFEIYANVTYLVVDDAPLLLV